MWAAPLVAGGVAAAAALPGLRFPFLSDDWHLVASVAHGVPMTPYEYFRPLYMASYWLDRALWGTSPFSFHLTNLMLLAACATLVVVVARRLTGDAVLAAATGLLFAIHPYHVENAAWIAVRGDPLYSIFVLLALLAYDRWRGEKRGIPFAALVLLALALLAKETAIVFLPLLAALAVVDPARRPDRRELVRGMLPLGIVGAAHLFVLRPLVLEGPGRTLTPGGWLSWVKHAVGFSVASVVPVDGEFLAARPFLYGAWAALIVGLLVVLALARGRGRLPRFVLGAAVVFAVLLAPSIIGFQERYLYLPAAASCLALAALIRSQPRVVAGAAGALVLGLWGWGCVDHWLNWAEAAKASRALVADLVTASREPETQEIVIVNVPFRVRGGSVAGDFSAALLVSGGRPIPVRGLAYVSYPTASDVELTYPDDHSGPIENGPWGAEVYFQVHEGPFSHFVGPRSPPVVLDRPGRVSGPIESSRAPFGEVTWAASRELLVVRVDAANDHSRAAYIWNKERLNRLF